jgi:hypothetical protein
VVKIKVEVFWIVMQDEDGGKKVLQNTGILPQH